MSNIVYIAASIDGYIADSNGELQWLECVPNPTGDDFGWAKFMNRIDALIMGRKTFDKVAGFDCPWPYEKPVFVLSRTMKSIPKGYEGKIELVEGKPQEVMSALTEKGHKNLYIDGGVTIHNFLEEGLIDELILTTIPVILGGGIPLFKEQPSETYFELKESKVLLNALVMNHYVRK